MSLTGAFRNHVLCLPAGTRPNVHRWVSDNLARVGFAGQQPINAEASCRCSQQRLAKQGWLTADYRRTDKPAPDPCD